MQQWTIFNRWDVIWFSLFFSYNILLFFLNSYSILLYFNLLSRLYSLFTVTQNIFFFQRVNARWGQPTVHVSVANGHGSNPINYMLHVLSVGLLGFDYMISQLLRFKDYESIFKELNLFFSNVLVQFLLTIRIHVILKIHKKNNIISQPHSLSLFLITEPIWVV